MSIVLVSLGDGVFRIRMNRPQAHNALDAALVDALIEALDEAVRAASGEKAARVVLLEGAGESFCAGADLQWMRSQGEATEAENLRSAQRLGELYERIDTLGLPVVARVHGPALGGGVGLAAASDIAVASSRAVFSFAEVRLGLVPALISPYVIGKIGMSHARELILTGRRIDAAEALRIGLVHRVAEESRLDEAVGEVVRELKAGGPQALAHAKQLLREVPRLLAGPRPALAGYTAREIAAARAREEGKAGTAAFLAKRRPPWAAEGGK